MRPISEFPKHPKILGGCFTVLLIILVLFIQGRNFGFGEGAGLTVGSVEAARELTCKTSLVRFTNGAGT